MSLEPRKDGQTKVSKTRRPEQQTRIFEGLFSHFTSWVNLEVRDALTREEIVWALKEMENVNQVMVTEGQIILI